MTVTLGKPTPQVALFRLNPQTGAVELTIEGLKFFNAVVEKLDDHETRLTDGSL